MDTNNLPEVEEGGAVVRPRQNVIKTKDGRCADCRKIRTLVNLEGRWVCLYDANRRIARYKAQVQRNAAKAEAHRVVSGSLNRALTMADDEGDAQVAVAAAALGVAA